MNGQGIADAIVKLVDHSGHPYKKWTVGVTDNPARRCKEYESGGNNTSWWHVWNADTEQATQTWFIDPLKNFVN